MNFLEAIEKMKEGKICYKLWSKHEKIFYMMKRFEGDVKWELYGKTYDNDDKSWNEWTPGCHMNVLTDFYEISLEDFEKELEKNE